MKRKREKLSAAEKQKRRERNERRGRKAERKSDEPRVATARALVGPPGLGRAVRITEGRKRAIMAVVDHAKKWENTEPCDCARCVHRRKLEEDFKRGKKEMQRAD